MFGQKHPMPALPSPSAQAPLLPLVAAMAVFAMFWPISTSDIELSYVPWFQHIAQVGPASALSGPFGDYSPPYYYLLAALSPVRGWFADESIVKLASVTGSLMLALAARHLLYCLRVEDSGRWAAYLLLLPGVIFNAAVSASCDGLWAAAGVMAVAAAVQRRHPAMLVWCGIALAIKAQAIFAAPFVIGLLIARRVPLWQWPLVAAAMTAAYLPAIALGWPVADLFMIYFRQADFFDRLSLNAPNIWAIIQLLPLPNQSALATGGYAASLIAALGLIAMIARKSFDGTTLLAAATLSVLLVAGLLPRMHERYFFLADVLVFCWAAALRMRSAWLTAGLVQLGSALGIAAYATATPLLAALGAIPMIAATVRIASFIVASCKAGDAGPIPEMPAEPLLTR